MIYRGRILFAGGNGRRSGALSAGKSFTTAVYVKNHKPFIEAKIYNLDEVQ